MSTPVVRIVLPWDVLRSVNARLNRVGDRLRLTRQYRACRDAAVMLVQRQVPDPRPRFTAPVALTIRFYEPDRRRRDPGNLVKIVEDALTGTVYDDDSRIVRETWERAGVDAADPRVELVVRAATRGGCYIAGGHETGGGTNG